MNHVAPAAAANATSPPTWSSLLDSLPGAFLQIEFAEHLQSAPQQRLPAVHLPVAQQPGLFEHLQSELALPAQLVPQLQPSLQQSEPGAHLPPEQPYFACMHIASEPHWQSAPQEQLPALLPGAQQPAPEH